MKIQIKSRFTGAVLFEHDAENNSIKLTVEAAVKVGASLDGASLDWARLSGANLDGANLVGAYLARANLDGANLARANLDGANLYGAYLDGANLARANLDGANLARANLDGANLDGANLDGAYLYGAYLAGERPIFQVGPIGSRCAYLISFLTTAGIKIKAGCFFGSRDEFAAKVEQEHGDSIHGDEYRSALALIDAHARLWTPAKTEQAKEAA